MLSPVTSAGPESSPPPRPPPPPPQFQTKTNSENHPKATGSRPVNKEPSQARPPTFAEEIEAKVKQRRSGVAGTSPEAVKREPVGGVPGAWSDNISVDCPSSDEDCWTIEYDAIVLWTKSFTVTFNDHAMQYYLLLWKSSYIWGKGAATAVLVEMIFVQRIEINIFNHIVFRFYFSEFIWNEM